MTDDTTTTNAAMLVFLLATATLLVLALWFGHVSYMLAGGAPPP